MPRSKKTKNPTSTPQKGKIKEQEKDRPITISFDGFGAGPGMGYTFVVQFRPKVRGFSLWIHAEDYETGKHRWTCLKKEAGQLSWRTALKCLAETPDARIAEDARTAMVEGLAHYWSEELLLRVFSDFEVDWTEVVTALVAFTDSELDEIHDRTTTFWPENGDLEAVTEQATDSLDVFDLASGIVAARMSGHTFAELCVALKVNRNLELSTILVTLLQFASESQSGLAIEILERGETPDWAALRQHSAPEAANTRLRLLVKWIELADKPVGGGMDSSSPMPTLYWLLEGDQVRWLVRLAESFPQHFEEILKWLMPRAKGSSWYFEALGRFSGMVANTFSKPLKAGIVKLGLDAQQVAEDMGIAIPPEWRIERDTLYL